MSEDPCQKENQTLGQAAMEWEQAATHKRNLLSYNPFAPSQGVVPLSKEDEDRYLEAEREEKEAHQRYMAAEKALMDCRRKHAAKSNE